MTKRLLEYTPAQLASLTKQQFLDGIRSSESRTVAAYSCPYAAPYVEKVSNPELVAAFGADYVILEGLDPRRLQTPGLPSKDPADDQPFKKAVQVEMGYGWTVRELKRLIGRPIGIILLVGEPGEDFGPVYGDAVYSEDMIRFVVEEGYDLVVLCGFVREPLLEAVRRTAELVGDRIVIEAGIPHGPGAIVDDAWPPFDLREVVTPGYVRELAEAGADIVDIPAVGVVPGFTPQYVTELATAVHQGRSLAGSCIAHSVEGADDGTIRRIALDNKACGVDLFNVAAGGVYESVALPETLLALCLAVKGRRHTYRRMAQSALR